MLRGLTERSRPLLALTAAILISLVGRPSFAQNPPPEAAERVALRWTAPTECPSREQVIAEISRLLSAGSEGAPLVTAEATVKRTESSGFEVLVRTERAGVRGERVLRGEDCVALGRATALLIAMAASPSDPKQPARPRDSEKKPPDLAPTPTRLKLRLAASLGYATALLDAPGGEFAGGVEYGRLRAELFLNAYLPRALSLGEDPRGGKFNLWGGGIATCISPWKRQGSWAVWGCIDGSAQRLEGRGFGVLEPSSAAATIFMITVQGEFEWQLSSEIGLALGLGADLPLSRRAFTLENVGVVHATDRVGARAQLGLAWRF